MPARSILSATSRRSSDSSCRFFNEIRDVVVWQTEAEFVDLPAADPLADGSFNGSQLALFCR
jgi:hypothetical protein